MPDTSSLKYQACGTILGPPNTKATLRRRVNVCGKSPVPTQAAMCPRYLAQTFAPTTLFAVCVPHGASSFGTMPTVNVLKDPGLFNFQSYTMMYSPGSIVATPDDSSPSSSVVVFSEGRSLTKSILDYEYSNGRRYHGFRAGQYLLPNDEQEQKRMDLLHHIWKILLGGEILHTEIETPQRILDIGTGTGLWAVDCADQFPMATVVATDLSPIQPTLVPENLQFFIDDAESDWDWEPFDLIHGRSLAGSIHDWPRFYQQCFDHMMPGGRIEIQEHDSLIRSADTKVPPWTLVWMTTLTKAFDDRGQSLSAADKHVQWMEDAGFVDVEDRVHQVPIGSWAKDKSLKELGRWHQVQMVDAVEPYTLAIYTDILGRDMEETQVAIEMVRKEFRENKHHLYVRYHFITGKKPD